MVRKNATAKLKTAPVAKKKRSRSVHGWKKPGVSKSIVLLTDESFRKDMLLAIDKTGIKSPTNVIRHLIKKFADEIRAGNPVVA
jgi:hypothetical protein